MFYNKINLVSAAIPQTVPHKVEFITEHFFLTFREFQENKLSGTVNSNKWLKFQGNIMEKKKKLQMSYLIIKFC